MGQLLPVLGNSRCGFKPLDSSVPMPSLWGVRRGKYYPVASRQSHGHLTFSPGQGGFSLCKMKNVPLED